MHTDSACNPGKQFPFSSLESVMAYTYDAYICTLDAIIEELILIFTLLDMRGGPTKWNENGVS